MTIRHRADAISGTPAFVEKVIERSPRWAEGPPNGEPLAKESSDADRFIKLDEVKRRVGLGRSMIYELIQLKRFPRPYKVSSCASRWSEREVTAWIDAIKAGSEEDKPSL